MAKVAIVYHSTYGHTKRMAEAVARGASSVDGVEVSLMTATEAIERLDELDSADAIIFGTATYMGNIASEMKRFMEATVKRWFPQAWRDKIAGGFTNSSSFSGDKLNTLMGLFVFAMQHGMIWVSTGVLPSENHPEQMDRIEGPGPEALNRMGSFIGPMGASFQVDTGPSEGDLATAEHYGKRVAEITLQFLKGRK